MQFANLSIIQISEVIFNVGAAFASIWAVYQYFINRRRAAVQWTQQLFEDFYVHDNFDEGRNLLDYNYHESLVTLLRMRVIDRDIQLSTELRMNLAHLDKILNYLEHLLYLEHSKVISPTDRKVFFDYWFSLLAAPNKATLRRYLRKCGYERLADEVSAQEDEHVVFVPAFLETEVGFKMLDNQEIIPAGDAKLPLQTSGDRFFDKHQQSMTYVVYKLSEPTVMHKIDDYAKFKRGDQKLKGVQRICMKSESCDRDIWVHVNYD